MLVCRRVCLEPASEKNAPFLTYSPISDNPVNAIAVQPDGKIIVGGDFTSIGSQPRSRIARLDGVTGAADSWNPNANTSVFTILVQPDGKILVGGAFGSIGGQTRLRLARLDAATGLADPLAPFFTGNIFAIALQKDGRILAGGDFTALNGVPRRGLVRLDGASGEVEPFDPLANGDIFSIALQADGKVLVSGGFTSIGGQSRNGVARLDGTSGAADSYAPNPTGSVFDIGIQPDGRVLACGNFTNIGGAQRSLFARLTNDTPAVSTLAVGITAIALSRDGAAPQLERVTFEKSVDNGVTYTFLGNAVPSLQSAGKNEDQLAPLASNYTLTGLSLPIAQNVLIRTRGYYHFSGSEITEEKVQLTYLLASPTAANVSVAGRVLSSSGAVPRAAVSLTDSNGTVRTVNTNTFGSFRFDGLHAGETVIMQVTAKGYTFAPQIVTLKDDLTELDFNAL